MEPESASDSETEVILESIMVTEPSFLMATLLESEEFRES